MWLSWARVEWFPGKIICIDCDAFLSTNIVKLRQGSGKERHGMVIKRPPKALRAFKLKPLPRAYIKVGCHPPTTQSLILLNWWPDTGQVRQVGSLWVTIGHLRVILSLSKHKANTTELHPKVRQTCLYFIYISSPQPASSEEVHPAAEAELGLRVRQRVLGLRVLRLGLQRLGVLLRVSTPQQIQLVLTLSINVCFQWELRGRRGQGILASSEGNHIHDLDSQIRDISKYLNISKGGHSTCLPACL